MHRIITRVLRLLGTRKFLLTIYTRTFEHHYDVLQFLRSFPEFILRAPNIWHFRGLHLFFHETALRNPLMWLNILVT